ncbi:MAG: hypothetical protein ACO1OB_01470, partial [Archangium sp.]
MSRHIPWVLFLLAGCSTRVDPCAALACGEGHCVIDTGSPRCVCAEARWSDGVCVRPDPCEVVSCGGLVGSSCEVHDGLARCVCPAGALAHEGSCVATNPCLPNPCTVVRRTTCEVVNGGAACRCDRGYAPEGNGCSAVPLWTCNTQHTGNGQDAAEPDECPPLASALPQNQVVQRNLSPSGDHDWFRVTPWLNEVTRFSVAADDTTLGLLVELYDESGATLLTGDNRGSSAASVAFTSRTGDAVMVRVRAVGGATGNYTARTESLGVDDFVDRAEEADHVLLPITVQGSSLHPGDLDVLWLDVPAQKAVTLRFEGEGARLELKRAGVTVRTLQHEETLLFSTPFDESVLAVVTPEVGEPLGTFRLVATVNGFDDHSNDVAFATRITADNAWQVGQTDTASDVDSFVISQQRAHRYVARWQALSGSTVPMVTVNEANGALIGASPNNATEFGWFGTSDDEAYVRLQNPNSGGATSRFQLAVDDLGADDHADEFDGATPVSFAMPGSGALSWNGDVDVFSFNAIAGHVVKISVAQVMGEPAPGVRLHGPNGPVASASNVIHALIEVGGPHFILVGPSGLSRYSVTLADVGPDDHGGTAATATPLLLDTVTTGSTQFTGDLDVFTATVTAGVVYQLEYSHSAQTREVRITQNGGSITASPLPVGARFSPQTSGTIVLTVTSVTPGDFQLRLVADGLDDVGNVPANATVLTPSMARSASLDFDRDVDVFRFQADARRVYAITATSPLGLQLQITQLNVSGIAVRNATAPPLTIARDTEVILDVDAKGLRSLTVDGK